MKIVVTEPQEMAQSIRASLMRLGPVTWGPFDDTGLKDALADAEVLVVRLGRMIDAGTLRDAPGLRYLVTATTGLDHIDLAAAADAGVRVISLRDCPDLIRDVSSTAEHTFGLLLALIRGTVRAANHVSAGGWERDLFWGSQLAGKRLGILGHGRIGGMVARYGAAFGMEILATDTSTDRITPPARPRSLAGLMAEADIISVHVTASPGNRHLIGRAELSVMKPGAFLVNTARGSIIDEAAVADAVSSGRLAGVAVDVLDGEETGAVGASPLLAAARAGGNVLITPHIGGASREAIAATEAAVVARLAECLATEEGDRALQRTR